MNLQRYELQNELAREMVRIKHKKPETLLGFSGWVFIYSIGCKWTCRFTGTWIEISFVPCIG
ncbi:MAG TPA: hypothetical protein VI413_14840 [Paludibacter sp.]